MKDLNIYRDLRDYLNSCSDEQLNQVIQILPPNPDYDVATRLEPVYAIGTIKEFEVEKTADTINFQHNSNNIVLIRDYPVFSKDGDSYYELLSNGDLVGNNSDQIIKW